MRSRQLLISGLGLLLVASVYIYAECSLAAEPTATLPGVAVVELFTSQGCSSCPPADELLQQIATQQSQAGNSVYVLSYHVDYWNRLGWTDPYSSAAASNRQREYARTSGKNQVYTPQMVVNGDVEFVGSDGRKASTAIGQSLQQTSPALIQMQTTNTSENKVHVAYQVTGQPAGTVLNLVAVYSPAANEVPKGENAGRSLKHVNVVRAFRSSALDEAANGELDLTLPADMNHEKPTIIAFVQDPRTLHISGATSAP